MPVADRSTFADQDVRAAAINVKVIAAVSEELFDRQPAYARLHEDDSTYSG